MSDLLLFLIIFKYVLIYTFDFYNVFVLEPVEEFSTVKNVIGHHLLFHREDTEGCSDTWS